MIHLQVLVSNLVRIESEQKNSPNFYFRFVCDCEVENWDQLIQTGSRQLWAAISSSMNKWMNELMNELMNEWIDEWMNW